MSTKLKIQFNDSSLEIEGAEDFVKQVYEDFNTRLKTEVESEKKVQTVKNSKPSTHSNSTTTKNNGKKSEKKGDDIKLVSNLDLYPNNNVSLKDFVNQFKNPSKADKYLLYVYYLKKILLIEKVNPNHIYTCIKDVGDTTPKYLSQTLHNLKREKGWIDTDDLNDIRYTIPGENQIEHRMEKVKN